MYIKNHDFYTISIILIFLSYLVLILMSHIYNEDVLKTNVYLKIADILCESCIPGGPQAPIIGERAGPPPPSASGSCLTADKWFHSECSNMIPVRSKGSTNAIRERVAWWCNKMAQEGGARGWRKKVAQ